MSNLNAVSPLFVVRPTVDPTVWCVLPVARGSVGGIWSAAERGAPAVFFGSESECLAWAAEMEAA